MGSTITISATAPIRVSSSAQKIERIGSEGRLRAQSPAIMAMVSLQKRNMTRNWATWGGIPKSSHMSQRWVAARA